MDGIDFRYVGHPGQYAQVVRSVRTGGRADGLRTADVHTGGGLGYTVMESRCMDIYDLSYQGINCAFMAKPGLLHPSFFSAAPGEFLRFFGAGMLYTCGLLNIGPPRQSAFETMPQHGRIAGTPAEEFAAGIDWQTGEIALSGVMRQAALFHERLTMRRRILSRVGGSSLAIEDTVANEGYEPADIRIMYHFNFGWPLLSERALLRLDTLSVDPWTQDARQGLDRWDRFEQPEASRPEEVFFHAPRPDGTGWARAEVLSEALPFGMRLTWDMAHLPVMVEWKSMQAGDYALGLEPASMRIDRPDEPAAPLMPGERRVFRVGLEAFGR